AASSGEVTLSNDGVSLTRADHLPSSGSRVADTDGATFTRLLASEARVNLDLTSGSYYFSMLVRKGDTGSARVAFYDGGNERWRIGINASEQTFAGVSGDSAGATLSNVLNDTLLIVGRITMGATDQARAKVFRSTDVVPTEDFFDSI